MCHARRIRDYYLNRDSNDEPRLDSVQNVENAVVTRADGWTVGEFRRKLDTGDNSGNTSDLVVTQARAIPTVSPVAVSFRRRGEA